MLGMSGCGAGVVLPSFLDAVVGGALSYPFGTLLFGQPSISGFVTTTAKGQCTSREAREARPPGPASRGSLVP